MELVLNDLFLKNPDVLSADERGAFFKYFHGKPFGCAMFQSNPLVQDDSLLRNHSINLEIRPSTITNIIGKARGTFWTCKSDLTRKSFICDYGGFVNLSPVKSTDATFFGLPERVFKPSIQPFTKWGFQWYFVGSENCPGTYINEMRGDTILDLCRCSQATKKKYINKKSVINCEMLENPCSGYNTKIEMFDSLESVSEYLIHPISIFITRRLEQNDELLMTYDNS